MCASPRARSGHLNQHGAAIGGPDEPGHYGRGDPIHQTREGSVFMATSALAETTDLSRDFIRDIVASDLRSGHVQQVVTRFPPEPNGYLHIGHAKSICLNFGVATEFNGRCNLRFDDTNPLKEEQEFIDQIQHDVHWLGFDWGDGLHFASDYFEQLYQWAEHLIRAGKAYVDDTPPEAMRSQRGTLTEPGQNSPDRYRSIDENLDLFRRMRAGEFPNGARVLRAKIDMAAGNINLRDPVLYRILHATHPRTGTKWCIYPTYDFAHGQSDAIEHVTHSICTLEFEDHRPLYDWLIENLPVPSRPRQHEFARLNVSYTVLSKRILTRLVSEQHVSGWDDPRMPTLAGMRRRGVPAAALREFVRRIGVARAYSTVDVAQLDATIRDVLNLIAPRRMAVLRPLKLIIENYPADRTETLQAINHPDDPSAGTRPITFGREIYIEQDDFMEDPPKKFFRLAPGREVRLRYGFFITCNEIVRGPSGEVAALRCTYDPATKGGNAPDGRKVQATLHWVAAADAVRAEVRLYEQLFSRPDPGADGDVMADLNPASMEIVTNCLVEPALAAAPEGEAVQFERLGYFCRDRDSTPSTPVFNRTVGLRDTWAKVQGVSSPAKPRR
jgi:glutaminyl-tRNA synthetase